MVVLTEDIAGLLEVVGEEIEAEVRKYVTVNISREVHEC
jgi:hypothetical protein